MHQRIEQPLTHYASQHKLSVIDIDRHRVLLLYWLLTNQNSKKFETSSHQSATTFDFLDALWVLSGGIRISEILFSHITGTIISWNRWTGYLYWFDTDGSIRTGRDWKDGWKSALTSKLFNSLKQYMAFLVKMWQFTILMHLSAYIWPSYGTTSCRYKSRHCKFGFATVQHSRPEKQFPWLCLWLRFHVCSPK